MSKERLAICAVKDWHWQLRAEAVRRLDDQALMANIVVNDKDWQVRAEAAKKHRVGQGACAPLPP